jgi:sarcosine oxidase gamma subunit
LELTAPLLKADSIISAIAMPHLRPPAANGKRQTIVGEAANTAYLSDQSHDRMATGLSRNNAHVVLSKGSAINLT